MAIEIITTVLLAAAPSGGAGAYDLVDLPTVLDELQLEPSDVKTLPFLKRGITQVSAAIANYCKRVFQVETVKDECYPERDAYPWQVPGGVFPLQVTRWPILPALVALSTASDTPSGATLPFASTAGLIVGMPAHVPSAVPGSLPPVALPDDAVIAAIDANVSVTLSTPVSADVPAGTIVNFGPRVVVVDTPGMVTDLVLGADYKIEADSGQLIRLNKWTGYPSLWDPVQTVVRYQAGFSPIPADIVDAVLRMMTARNDERGRSPYLKSRDQPGIGTETYWIGDLPGRGGMFSPDVRDLLDSNYRVPTVR